ncbi:MAG: hypothetical protein WD052_08605 [Bacteroidales bacterium]
MKVNIPFNLLFFLILSSCQQPTTEYHVARDGIDGEWLVEALISNIMIQPRYFY